MRANWTESSRVRACRREPAGRTCTPRRKPWHGSPISHGPRLSVDCLGAHTCGTRVPTYACRAYVRNKGVSRSRKRSRKGRADWIPRFVNLSDRTFDDVVTVTVSTISKSANLTFDVITARVSSATGMNSMDIEWNRRDGIYPESRPLYYRESIEISTISASSILDADAEFDCCTIDCGDIKM